MTSSQPLSHPPIDEQFAVLADPLRRAILRHLGHHGTISFDALCTDLAAQSLDEPTLALELRHVHLPRLEDVGFIAYDPAARLIELTGAVDDRLVHVLEHDDAENDEYGVQI